ncbi:MAG TPA: flavodoxin [Clostridiaceae bacterium]|nr:flavodoxin [Clostridiaceae bacterium]
MEENMKAAVIYSSKTGYTKKYAKWIADELSVDAHELNGQRKLDEVLSDKEVLIYGGGLYAIGINGLKEILSAERANALKKIIVFTTGLSHDSEEVRKEIFENNLKETGVGNISLYYFRGGFDYSSLGFVDKILMRLLKLKIGMKKRKGGLLTSDEKGMLTVFQKKVDFTNRKYLDKLLEEVNHMES